ncbi:MAG: hypothetical protein ACM3RP_10760 [Chitinophagales bacterium]
MADKEKSEPEVIFDELQTETASPRLVNPWTEKIVNRPLFTGPRVCEECGTEATGWTDMESAIMTCYCRTCNRLTSHRFRTLAPAQPIEPWFYRDGDAVRMMLQALGWTGRGNTGGWVEIYDEHGRSLGKRHGYGAAWSIVAPAYTQAFPDKPLPQWGNPFHREIWRCAKCLGKRTVDLDVRRGILSSDWHQCGFPW